MKILKYAQLLEKYREDNRSLSFSEENLILNLNEEFCEKEIDVYHLSKDEKYDIVNGKIDDAIKVTKELLAKLDDTNTSKENKL